MKQFEFSDEEVSLIWELIDMGLKVGGIKNLPHINIVVGAMQRNTIEEKKD